MFFRANNHELVQQELTRLKSQINTSNNLAKKKINISRLLRDRATRRGMIIAFGLIAGQQFSGIVAMVNIYIYLSKRFFQTLMYFTIFTDQLRRTDFQTCRIISLS